MKYKILGLIMVLSVLGCKQKTEEEKFWKWFKKNETMLFEFNDSNMDKVFDKLATEMNKVHPDLTFEFSPVFESGKREFVISAAGIKEAFPKVESLFKSAPKLNKWIWVKFRPRRKPMVIKIGEKQTDPADVKCQLFKDGDKVGIMLFFKDYSEKEKTFYGQTGYLLLDQALGEYDVETKVGFIEFTSTDSKSYKKSFEFSELTERVDDYFKTK